MCVPGKGGVGAPLHVLLTNAPSHPPSSHQSTVDTHTHTHTHAHHTHTHARTTGSLRAYKHALGVHHARAEEARKKVEAEAAERQARKAARQAASNGIAASLFGSDDEVGTYNHARAHTHTHSRVQQLVCLGLVMMLGHTQSHTTHTPRS